MDATVSLTQPGLFYRNAPGGAMDILGQTSYLFLPAVNTPGQGNPIWILMDLLVRANWTYSQLNIQSFINAALKCQVQIPYTNNAGVVTMYNNPTINEPNSTPPPPHPLFLFARGHQTPHRGRASSRASATSARRC